MMYQLASLLHEPLAMDVRAIPYLLQSVSRELEERRTPDEPPPVSISLVNERGTVDAATGLSDAQQGSLVAVVPLSGVMTRHGHYAAPGTLELGRVLQRLDSDPAVGSIALNISSPGGTVYGTTELATIARNIREAGQTKIVSVVDPLMASAATWVGTAVSRVYATPSADVGSIGVFSAYADFSEMLSNAGIKVDVIRTPALKARFTGVEPLTDEMRETMEASIKQSYREFVSSMAANRGVSEQHVEDRFGGGEVMTAPEGVEAGLIDGIASLDEAVSTLVQQASEQQGRRRRAAELSKAEREAQIELAEVE